jgi:hypothetical protein
MPCQRFRDALTDAAAGAPVGTALEAHLAACDGCRSELAQLRDVMATADESLSMLAAAEPSPALRARIREAVGGQVPVGLAPWWRFAWPAAAAAVLALAALGAWRSFVERRPPSPVVAESGRPTPAAVATASTASVGAQVAPRASSAVEPAGPARAPSRTPVRRGGVLSPEVLVPPGQQEALLQLVALVHGQGMRATALAAAGEPSADLVEPAPIEIRPLDTTPVETVPLDPAGSSGTD